MQNHKHEQRSKQTHTQKKINPKNHTRYVDIHDSVTTARGKSCCSAFWSSFNTISSHLPDRDSNSVVSFVTEDDCDGTFLNDAGSSLSAFPLFLADSLFHNPPLPLLFLSTPATACCSLSPTNHACCKTARTCNLARTSLCSNPSHNALASRLGPAAGGNFNRLLPPTISTTAGVSCTTPVNKVYSSMPHAQASRSSGAVCHISPASSSGAAHRPERRPSK
mmetsp:Transcript_34762/g.85084  ORF Transcript_34762/g.85084 Transcript_34762/m.85084 type:complete len:221 (+) Transcript_34762:124-786(+)